MWQLAETDETVREKLEDMYALLRDILVNGMKKEGIGSSKAQRAIMAQLFLSQAYGEVSFAWLGLNLQKKNSSRKLAETMIVQLQNDKLEN